jgi:hypothetical protein
MPRRWSSQCYGAQEKCMGPFESFRDQKSGRLGLQPKGVQPHSDGERNYEVRFLLGEGHVWHLSWDSDNTLWLIESIMPNKTDALNYLDKKGQAPTRYARVSPPVHY